jgi:hypothetical protein
VAKSIETPLGKSVVSPVAVLIVLNENVLMSGFVASSLTFHCKLTIVAPSALVYCITFLSGFSILSGCVENVSMNALNVSGFLIV